MTRVSNETLLAEIVNVKKDTGEIKDDCKKQWEQININRENIASHKSTMKIIEVFITGIVVSIIGFFWSNK